MELAPHGVRVNAVAPGPTDTPVFGKAGVPAEHVEGLKQAFLKGLPLGRIGTPAEVAAWILSVSAPTVTWMTGQVISIDGGMSLT